MPTYASIVSFEPDPSVASSYLPLLSPRRRFILDPNRPSTSIIFDGAKVATVVIRQALDTAREAVSHDVSKWHVSGLAGSRETSGIWKYYYDSVGTRRARAQCDVGRLEGSGIGGERAPMPDRKNAVAGDLGQVRACRSVVVGRGRHNPGVHREGDVLAVFPHRGSQRQEANIV